MINHDIEIKDRKLTLWFVENACMMKKYGAEEFCFIILVVIIPKTIIFSVPELGNVEAPLFDTQKEGGIGIVLFLKEKCGDGERKSVSCGGECINELVLLETRLGAELSRKLNV